MMRLLRHGTRWKTSLIGVLPIEAHGTPTIRSGRLDKGRFSLVFTGNSRTRYLKPDNAVVDAIKLILLIYNNFSIFNKLVLIKTIQKS